MAKGIQDGCQSGFQDRDEDQALDTPWGSQLPGGGGRYLLGVGNGSEANIRYQVAGVMEHSQAVQNSVSTGMNAASVTLASALQVRGEALSEEEIWSLLSMAAERLLEDLRNDSSDYVICPWSLLLSAAGSLSFQDHVSHIEAAPFKAPELLQGPNEDEQSEASQMHVYSLGMTLYWSAGYRVPPNQPLQLREPVHSLLLAMCEDQPQRRRPLQAVLEACRVHQEEVAVYPAPASLHISRLVGLVLGTISEVERRVVEEGTCERQSRSYFLRSKLHRAASESPGARASDGVQLRRVSERSTETQSSSEQHWSTTAHSPCGFPHGALAGVDPCDCEEGLRCGSGPMLLAEAESSQLATSPRNFLQRNGKASKEFSRPEFILLAGEAPVTLHLPGSIVTKKGKSYLALRDLCVVLLSGQCLEVKCHMESTAGAVFNAVMSFTNLGETIYFGLAYVKGEEFFFLDKDTRLCKVAPEGWREQYQKGSTDTLTLFLRIKFFVSHYGLLQHRRTRHQLYLQLRKDVLEERLYCNDETLLQLGVLALQAEFGSYPKEVENKAYFRIQDYIPARLIERMTAIRAQVEISEMHRLSSAPWGEDAELKFLEWAFMSGLTLPPTLLFGGILSVTNAAGCPFLVQRAEDRVRFAPPELSGSFRVTDILMNAFSGCCEHFVLHFFTLSPQVCTKLGREIGGTFVLLRSMFSWSTQHVFLEHSLRNGAVGAKAHGLMSIGKNNLLVAHSSQCSKGKSGLLAPLSLCYLLLGEESMAGWVWKGIVENRRQITLFHFQQIEMPQRTLCLFVYIPSLQGHRILVVESEFSESNELLY
ncbi:FERM and PDZ domain-containing protein 2-like [Microtus oregoni]|uniref:FERM and PDZ domain-containing protein 2-like n=1 Tax=Microtus oregoni TaxID=111838 RepID=UPI001BB1EFF2|nr:FERM and PDZ domain-containing protein 2-like [Microtus oregoni]